MEEKKVGGYVITTPQGDMLISADHPLARGVPHEEAAVLVQMEREVLLEKLAISQKEIERLRRYEEDTKNILSDLMHPNQYLWEATRTEADPRNGAMDRLSDVQTVRLLHAGIGLSTETGEFLGALKKWIFYGKPLDRENLLEELGDLCWYIAVACTALEGDFEEILKSNIRKLRSRFPEKFTEALAADENRDLVAEKEALLGVGTGVMAVITERGEPRLVEEEDSLSTYPLPEGPEIPTPVSSYRPRLPLPVSEEGGLPSEHQRLVSPDIAFTLIHRSHNWEEGVCLLCRCEYGSWTSQRLCSEGKF